MLSLADADASNPDATNGQDDPPLVMRATKDLGNSSCTVSVLAVATAAGDEPGSGLYHMSWSRIHRSGPARLGRRW